MHRPFFITESQIYLSKDIERIQLRAMRIIFPRSRKSYNEAISLSINLGKLEERRQAACDNLFKEIIEDPNHKLRGTIAGFELKYCTFPHDMGQREPLTFQ